MNSKTFNIVSPLIFSACAAIVIFLTHLIIRGQTGLGIIHPGFLSHIMLIFVAVFILSVWGTVGYVAYQIHKIYQNKD